MLPILLKHKGTPTNVEPLDGEDAEEHDIGMYKFSSFQDQWTIIVHDGNFAVESAGPATEQRLM